MNFNKLSTKYQEKSIVRLCKKLEKSSSLTKSKDTEMLCELAYRLYIYDDMEEILKIYSFSNIEIPEKVNYNIWTWILYIWGLQAFVFQQKGNIKEQENIISQTKKVYATPRNTNQTQEEAWAFYQRIADRQTLEKVCNEEKIEQALICGDQKSAQAYLFSALYKMISYGAMDFYPQLESQKQELLKKITKYILYLKN